MFRYSHWAGITDYTSRFRVAVCYVVIRQSELPGHCDLPDLQAGTPSPKVTGPICRVPLTRLNPTRLRLFSEGHLCQFSVRTFISLFMDSRNLSSFLITLSLASHHCGTPRDYTLKRGDDPAQHTPKCQGSEELQMNGTGILTCFPFDVLELRYTLGPTNPRLTNIAEET